PCSPIAQLAEQRTVNPWVAGSIPARGAILLAGLERRPLALNTTAPASSSWGTGVSALNSARSRRARPLPAHSLPVRTRSGGPEDTGEGPAVYRRTPI